MRSPLSLPAYSILTQGPGFANKRGRDKKVFVQMILN
jgi:hypothetical protein